MMSTGMPLTNSVAPEATMPKVTAGFRCPPDLYETSTPAKTARPQPKLTIRNPVPSPLFFGRMLLATTPAPSNNSMAVPTVSERKMVARVIIVQAPFDGHRAGTLPNARESPSIQKLRRRMGCDADLRGCRWRPSLHRDRGIRAIVHADRRTTVLP